MSKFKESRKNSVKAVYTYHIYEKKKKNVLEPINTTLKKYSYLQVLYAMNTPGTGAMNATKTKK